MGIAEVVVGRISLAGVEGAYEVQMVWRGSSGWPSDEIAGLVHLSRYYTQKHL